MIHETETILVSKGWHKWQRSDMAAQMAMADVIVVNYGMHYKPPKDDHEGEYEEHMGSLYEQARAAPRRATTLAGGAVTRRGGGADSWTSGWWAARASSSAWPCSGRRRRSTRRRTASGSGGQRRRRARAARV